MDAGFDCIEHSRTIKPLPPIAAFATVFRSWSNDSPPPPTTRRLCIPVTQFKTYKICRIHIKSWYPLYVHSLYRTPVCDRELVGVCRFARRDTALSAIVSFCHCRTPLRGRAYRRLFSPWIFSASRNTPCPPCVVLCPRLFRSRRRQSVVSVRCRHRRCEITACFRVANSIVRSGPSSCVSRAVRAHSKLCTVRGVPLRPRRPTHPCTNVTQVSQFSAVTQVRFIFRINNFQVVINIVVYSHCTPCVYRLYVRRSARCTQPRSANCMIMPGLFVM